MARCVECGFLATRDYESRQLVEVDSDFRRSGAPTAAPGSRRHSQERAPICFVQSIDLQAELLGQLEPNYPPGSAKRAQILDAAPGDVIRELFQLDRPDCDANEKFTLWQQGFTPKEHREMLDRESLLDREDSLHAEVRKREDDRDVAVSKREDDRDAAALRRHNRQMEAVRWQHWRELAVFGGAIIFATLLGSLIEAEWLREPPWFDTVWPFG